MRVTPRAHRRPTHCTQSYVIGLNDLAMGAMKASERRAGVRWQYLLDYLADAAQLKFSAASVLPEPL
jgi:hypothetical protein